MVRIWIKFLKCTFKKPQWERAFINQGRKENSFSVYYNDSQEVRFSYPHITLLNLLNGVAVLQARAELSPMCKFQEERTFITELKRILVLSEGQV